MAYKDYIPDEDSLYLAWLTNFASQCSAYSTLLGLTAPQVAQIEALPENFEEGFNGNVSAKAAAKAAVQNKNRLRQSTEATARQYARIFKANPSVTPELEAQLGIISSSTSGPVVPVSELTVTGCSDGVNQLRWNRNGNAQGSIFVIEYQLTGSTDWDLAGVVTSSKFDHDEQTPGVEMAYRVVTTRSGKSSVPCPPVVVYRQEGNGESLSLAA